MFLIISSSPNTDGLTAACVTAAEAGCAQVGMATRHLNLCTLSLARCRQCENGWGRCRREHNCIIEDDLRMIQDAIVEAEGVVVISPVYYGELSESAKTALDRIRRCEATYADQSALAGKPVIAVAAAGGSGGGVSTCLAQIERYVQHMRGQTADLIGITRRNREYKLATIQAAVTALAASLAPVE